MNLLNREDEMLANPVKYVLEGQFKATEYLLKGKTDDRIIFCADLLRRKGRIETSNGGTPNFVDYYVLYENTL